MMQGIKNPQTMLNQMAQTNPKFQQAQNLIKQYGTPEKAFRNLAQSMGRDPDELINMLK